jgi:transposase-like protein
MTTKRTRRTFTTEQKVAILRRYLVDKVAISDLCDEYKIQPSLLYLWQRQVFEKMGLALEDGRSRRGQGNREVALEREIETLQAKLAKKDRVIAEISEEYVQLKKELGES